MVLVLHSSTHFCTDFPPQDQLTHLHFTTFFKNLLSIEILESQFFIK